MSICLPDWPPLHETMAYKIRVGTTLENTFGVRKTYFSYNVNLKSNLSTVYDHMFALIARKRGICGFNSAASVKSPRFTAPHKPHNLKNHIERCSE